MKRACILLITICLLVAGCATVKISEQNTTLVMAKEVDKEKGVKNISSTFTYEGNIYAYATFTWNEKERAGHYTVEAKWFNGDKLIHTKHISGIFESMPWAVWFTTRGTTLGVGKCRVEVYVDDVLVGSKYFTVVEK